MKYEGEHLVVRRGLYTHHGIGDSAGGVIHYSGLADGLLAGPVCRTSLAEFASGNEIVVRTYTARQFTQAEAVVRAESRLGEDAYSVWGNNCEHFCEWCITGNHESRQVDRGAVLGTAGLTAGARRAAIAVIASEGTVAGLSGSGVMSGLASVGGLVGGGAVAGMGVLGAVGGTGMAALLNNTVFEDDPAIPADERAARSAARKATYGGAAAATIGGIATVSSLGTAGLSAAGITSGLAAVGSLVGGGMAAGAALVAVAPVVGAVACGYGAHRLWKWSKLKRSPLVSQ